MNGETKKEDVFVGKPEPKAAPVEPPKQEEVKPPVPAAAGFAMTAATETELVPSAGVAVIDRVKEIEDAIKVEQKMLELVRVRLGIYEMLKGIALKKTNYEDWVYQGDKLYLEITGAEKIAPVFGITVARPEKVVEKGTDELGDWIRIYHYTPKASFHYMGIEMYSLEGIMGSCSTRDDFFGMNKGKPRPLYEIDIADIEKKSYSNMMLNSVTRLLGLRSVVEKELKASGFDEEDFKKIRKVERGAPVSDEDKVKQEELFGVVKGLVGTDGKAVRAKVRALSGFTKDGKEIYKENYSELTGKWLDNTLRKAKEEAEKQDREGGGGR